jgi:hypothetical protein
VRGVSGWDPPGPVMRVTERKCRARRVIDMGFISSVRLERFCEANDEPSKQADEAGVPQC